MPRKPSPKITAWSYSRLNDYRTCPLKAKLKHVDKIKEPSSAPMQRGSDIDKMAEDYVAGKLKKLPDELELFTEEFVYLRSINKRVALQQQWAIDAKWNPVDWFDSSVWYRGKADAQVLSEDGETLTVIDFKTGKIREGYKEQLEIYAFMGFLYGDDNIKVVRPEIWYTDQGVLLPDPEDKGTYPLPEEFTRKDIPKLKRKMINLPKKMLADRTFAPTPSRLCGWCWFSKGNVEGPKLCKY